MIIGVCGFVATGSSAVSDYLQEFEDVSVIDNFEFQLSHAPDGLEDLDFQLNHHCAKYASSVVAIERFRRFFFNSVVYPNKDRSKNKALIGACDKFIEAISQVTWMGYGGVDNQLYCGRNYDKWLMNRFFPRVAWKAKKEISHIRGKEIAGYPLHDMKFALQPKEFDVYAKQLVMDVLSILGVDFNKKIVLDQPFSGTNPCLGFPYFNDPRAIVVDRDPRDLFLFAKNFLRVKGAGYQMPVDVHEFVKYYRNQRECRFFDAHTKGVLSIHFEDLVYNYEETTQKIDEFCGLNPKNRKKKVFDPSISIRNTQMAKRYPQDKEYVDYIEKMLPEYLYDFERFRDIDTSGSMFFGRALNKKQ